MTTTDDRRGARPRRLAMLALAVVTGLATGLGGALVTETGAVAATTSQYGTLSAASGSLPSANQCGTYSYRYDITPPPGTWDLETTVIDPRGLAVSSLFVIGGYSPGGAGASTSYTLCRNNTLAGTFTITGTLSTQTKDSRGNLVTTSYEMTPGTFTLTDAPVATTTQKAKKSKKAKKRAKAKRKAEQRKKKNRNKHKHRR